MKKEMITEAASVEEAKQAAAQALGKSEEELTFEVLREPQKKTLGLFGGCTAQVKATVTLTPASAAAAYLKEILAAMGCGEVAIAVTEEGNTCTLALEGEDLGFVIGRRGDTLDALQYLVGLVANRVDNAYYRVTLDIGDYRAKREKALSGLARKIGGQVARTGRKHSLEPMNPYERRIIHTVIQGMDGVTSWSVGSEPNRHVIIGPADEGEGSTPAPKSGRSRNRNRSRGNGGRERSERQVKRDDNGEYVIERPERPVRQFVPRSNPLPVADGATPPSRTESEKESTASLYGRIDL